MKVIVLLALLGISYGADRPNEQEWNQRSLLVLRPVITQSSGSEPLQRAESTEEVSRTVMAKLRTEQGAQTGTYYVYQPDGRLQKVEYTTAPLRVAASESDFKQFTQPAPYVQLPPRFHYVKDVDGKFARVQQPTADSSNQQGTTQKLTASEVDKPVKGYVASVQYTDVNPIDGPVYSYDSSPLVRIVRYAENY